MSIHPDDVLLLANVDKIRDDLVRIEAAAKTANRKTVGDCFDRATDLVRRAERILAIILRYRNG